MAPDTRPEATAAAPPATAEQQTPPRLRRVLGLGDLIFYGIVLIQPVGADQRSFGHVTLTILIALAAMMLTAWSYGRMAGLYPSAGSAYTYVGRGMNPHFGFIAGWAMFLDYLVIPTVSVIYGAISVQKVVEEQTPGLTHRVVASLSLPLSDQRVAIILWVVLFVSLTTFLNVRGIKWTAWANQVLTAVMFLVIGIFVVQAVRFLWAGHGWSGLLSTKPFYNPHTFNLRAIGTATSLAALTYIGFDGITTLAEDVKEPKRTVPLAVVLVCLLIGLCVSVQVYLAQLAWPDYAAFKDPDSAFFDVCKLVGGTFLLNAMALIVAVACLGSALTGQVGAARILFGMGRDNALPRFFARLDKKSNPVLNIWLIGALALVGALSLDYEKAATLINFGAFLAFMGVNLAVIRELYFRSARTHQGGWPSHLRAVLLDLLAPAVGFLFCLLIWLSLPTPAKIVGGIWCEVGLLYIALRGYGLRILFSFKGRIEREPFWLILIAAALACVVPMLMPKGGAAMLVFRVICLSVAAWMALPASARRWHDRGKSGLMVLINLAPGVGALWTIVELGFFKGTAGPNPYGDKPLEPRKQPVTLDLSGA
jgi:amino acid transporter